MLIIARLGPLPATRALTRIMRMAGSPLAGGLRRPPLVLAQRNLCRRPVEEARGLGAGLLGGIRRRRPPPFDHADQDLASMCEDHVRTVVGRAWFGDGGGQEEG